MALEKVMGIVSTYTRAHGSLTSGAGEGGTLRSTRQKRPYETGPYRTIRVIGEKPHPQWGNAKSYVHSILGNSDSNFGLYHRQRSTEYARARLNNTLIKGRAALGITAATANQSFAMIANRASTLHKAYKACRKGNVKQLERTLGLARHKNGTYREETLRFTRSKLPADVVERLNSQRLKREAKGTLPTKQDAAGLWLEYTFGWVPLVADVGAAVKVASDPFEVHRSFGTCSLNEFKQVTQTYYKLLIRSKIRTVCTAGLRVDNPNVALLTQLGLANPLAVAWDIIPFSFVVDWFFKVSTYLNRWNDMAGFSYIDPVTTINQRAEVTVMGRGSPVPASYMSASTGRLRERTKSIVNRPRLPYFRLPTPSLWLAATSSSLLVQVFGKKK